MRRVLRSGSVFTGVTAALWESKQPIVHGDSLDCKEKVCKSKMEMLQKAFGSAKSPSTVPLSPVAPYLKSCPVDKDDLGSQTWTLLHTLAAHYPTTPTPQEQEMIKQFYASLAHFYPCKICAEDLQKSVAESPPAAHSREAMALWTCQLHNEVNIKLGKPSHPCVLAELDARWLDGGDDCDEGSEAARPTQPSV